MKMRYVLSLALLLLSVQSQLAAAEERFGDRDDPEVTILQGTLKGAKLVEGGERVDRFLSIPYGKPPVGDLRFRPTEPADPWEGTLDASIDLDPHIREKSCIQMKGTMKGTRGNEDCLYLNVWVYGGVEEAKKNPLPVMVWMYGGAYAFGSSGGANFFDNWLYDQEPLVRHGQVIGITLEYRLGPLGFLSTGDEASPGNYGLLDQVEALKWVKNNIWAFGGDDTKITVYGESAGSASTSFHMISPLSKDLFARGISESGTALSSWAVIEEPERWAHDVGAGVGCPTDDNQLMMDCLRVADVDDVVLAVHLINSTKEQTIDLPWSAVVDGYFLPDYPQNLVANSADKDYLLGNNDMDGHMFAGMDFWDINKDNTPMYLSDLVKAAGLLHYDTPQEVQDAIVFQYKAFTNDYDDTFYKKQIVQLYTDIMFAAPTHATAASHAKVANRNVNTFVYLFSCPSKMPLLYPPWMGADHADDLQYVYGKPFLTPLVYTQGERDASEAMMTYWTNFAWTGDPNEGPGWRDNTPAEWKAYDLENKYYLEINGSIKDNGDSAVGSNYRSDYFAFWERLVPQIWKSADGECDTGLHTKASTTSESFDASGCSESQYQRLTTFGCVQGEQSTWNGIPFSRYLGIPYANPIVSEAERFTQPESPAPWTETRDALSFSKMCPQAPFDDTLMDEDCLYLNIYQPDPISAPSDGYAVMVWFHGGDQYSTGSGSQYDGSVLSAKENVVVVTVNYRLGSLGFLSSSGTGISGNMGLLDQQMALDWIRFNIENFGGNINKITVFGQGVGADAVHMHSLSDMNADLGISRGILQSGSALNFANYPDQRQTAKQLANRVGCSTQGDAMISCLRNLTASEIIAAQSKSPAIHFSPVVDGKFLTDEPQLLMTSQQNPWTFMIGTNRNDGSTQWDNVVGVTSYRKFHTTIKNQFASEYGVKTDNIEFEYTLWSDASFESNVQEMQQQLLDIYTDLDYALNTVQVADNSDSKNTPVYVYQFARASEFSSTANNFTFGAGHGDELSYVWGDVVYDVMAQGAYPEDSMLSFDVMGYWCNFVKTGNPNIDELGYNDLSVEWLPYSSADKEYLRLDTEYAMLSNFKERKSQFWSQFLPALDVTCPIDF